MGRTKKIVESTVGNEVSPVELVEMKQAEVKPVKALPITVTATYKTKTLEGELIKHRFSGTGANELEALNNVKGSDEELVDEYGAEFPKKVNLLVNVTVKRGDYQFDRAIAPHTTNDIFVNKNVVLLRKLFGL